MSRAFIPQSRTMLVTTDATPNTADSQALVFPGSGASQMHGNEVPPPACLVTNLGTAVVWVSITVSSTRTAAIPSAGNTTFEVPVFPGTSQVFTAPWAQGSSGAEGVAGVPRMPGSATLYLNTICGQASQSVTVTFGEGT